MPDTLADPSGGGQMDTFVIMGRGRICDSPVSACCFPSSPIVVLIFVPILVGFKRQCHGLIAVLIAIRIAIRIGLGFRFTTIP